MHALLIIYMKKHQFMDLRFQSFFILLWRFVRSPFDVPIPMVHPGIFQLIVIERKTPAGHFLISEQWLELKVSDQNGSSCKIVFLVFII